MGTTPYSKLRQAQRCSEGQRRRWQGASNGGPLLGISTAIGFDGGPAPSPFRQCQWIEGESAGGTGYGDLPICGQRTKPGSSYCPEHHARCYQKISPLRRIEPNNVPGFSAAIRPFKYKKVFE